MLGGDARELRSKGSKPVDGSLSPIEVISLMVDG
jgi:hypothetical protein